MVEENKKLKHTTAFISLRNESGNAFKKEILRIEVSGHNGISITGSITVTDGKDDKVSFSFALNSANVLFITRVGNNGISFDYLSLIEKTQPELTSNILLLYKNYQKNIA